MDDIFSIVRTTIGSVLDFPAYDRDRELYHHHHQAHHHYRPGRTASAGTHSAVVPLAPTAHRDHNCVDLLLRLLGGCGATEKRINALPVVTLKRTPGSAAKAAGAAHDHDHAPVDDADDDFHDPTVMFDQDTCSICLDSYEASNTVRVLGCCHVYHASCIEIWLRRRPTCPMCNLTAC